MKIPEQGAQNVPIWNRRRFHRGGFPNTGNILLKLLFPEGLVAFRGRGVFTAFMTVPETAVDEDNCFIFWQNDIRLAGQGADVFAEAVSDAV